MTYIRPIAARRGRFLKSRRINYDEGGVRQAQIVAGEGVNITYGSTGTSVSFDPAAVSSSVTFWIRLFGGDGLGKYAWNMILATSTTADPYGWKDATGDGTSGTLGHDPAIEANNCGTLLDGTRVEVRREQRTNQIRFQLETCRPGSGPTTIGTTTTPPA